MFFLLNSRDDDSRFVNDEQIDKIISNYENSFIEKYDFWLDLISKNVNGPYKQMVKDMLECVDRLDLLDTVYDEISYDSFCVSFMEKLKEFLAKERIFDDYALISVINTIITNRIISRIPMDEMNIWEEYYMKKTASDVEL